MRKLIILAALAIAGCAERDAERYTATVDVDMSAVEAMLTAMDSATDSSIDVRALVEMTTSVPMDAEKQADLVIRVDGRDVEMFYHVWREQPDWVHIYASSTSRELVDAVQAAIAPFARAAEESAAP
ncbi:MAG: hypothetical protein R3358_04905 [Woeseiaceae bacterium]|nr:hypothetical protein [Woeseiaceae bacterium]